MILARLELVFTLLKMLIQNKIPANTGPTTPSWTIWQSDWDPVTRLTAIFFYFLNQRRVTSVLSILLSITLSILLRTLYFMAESLSKVMADHLGAVLTALFRFSISAATLASAHSVLAGFGSVWQGMTGFGRVWQGLTAGFDGAGYLGMRLYLQIPINSAEEEEESKKKKENKKKKKILTAN